MKVQCARDILKDALLQAERFTGKQLSLPILSHVLLLASESHIKLRATNLDLGVEISLPAKVFTEGVIAVPASILGNYLSLLPNEKQVSIELVGQNLSISSESHTTIIKCSPYEDFPSIPTVNKGGHIKMDAHTLAQGLRAVSFSAANTDIKPEFSSVHWYTDSGYLMMVATDSSRLSEKKISVKKIDDDISLLIPIKNVNEVIRVMEGYSGMIDIYANNSQISFLHENIHITSRLIDGMFPDYKQIIPKQVVAEAVVLKDDLINTLKISQIFSGKLQQTRIVIDPKEGVFEVGTKNDEIGETSNQVSSALKGERVDLMFNQRFLLDPLQYISQDSISLSSAGTGKPLILRGVGDQTFLYLVMPIRVS